MILMLKNPLDLKTERPGSVSSHKGRQNLTNTERKGPHKSMHCKFCKPPGVITPEKPSGPLLETKTNIHLAHEAADLRLCNTSNEPGFPIIESEACICVLEGEHSCPKCVPDKNWSPPKKKVCRCPKGAKAHPSMYLETAPKQKKPKHEDNEFWWEKYSREHDLIAQETWKAYMAQRRKEKKFEKVQKRKKFAVLIQQHTKAPLWYQKFSCQQMTCLESLSTAIRLDSDENITDRTFFVLAGIGLFPRPKRKVLKKCLSYCHYNAIHFLNQLRMLIKDDVRLRDEMAQSSSIFSWNEKLIMNCMCHLEFPAFLREIMDRLPPLPRPKLLPQIPYPVYPALPKKKYKSPYEEPIWQDRLNWVEKMKIDRLNRCRAHMETKRVKIPSLALVRRPSLIDARPPFLSQIEANERASRRLVKGKEKKRTRKHPISTFNSSVDVTAIAGIEASEISATEKEDADDICVFLRGNEKEGEDMAGEMEVGGEHDFPDKEVKFIQCPKVVETQVDRLRACADYEDMEELGETEDIPFRTPPKTLSGATISSPCPPPYATPGPPATHFEKARRELDIINEEICGFFPYVSESAEIIKEEMDNPDDTVELKLESAAKKLKEYISDPEGEQETKKSRGNKEGSGVALKKVKKRHKKRSKSRSSKKSKKSKSKKCKSKKKCRKSKKSKGPKVTKKRSKKLKKLKKSSVRESTNSMKPKSSQMLKRPLSAKSEMPLKKSLKQESDFDIYSMTANVIYEEEDMEEDEEEEEDEDEVPDEKEVKTPQKPLKPKLRSLASVLSDPDPDPDTDDAWSTRPPCTPKLLEEVEQESPAEAPARKSKKGRKFSKRPSQRRRPSRASRSKYRPLKLSEEKGDYLKKGYYPKAAKEVMSDSNHFKDKDEEKYEKTEEKVPPKDVFRGDVNRLVTNIIEDLAEEGFYCATFPYVSGHPDVTQLIMHLRGELNNKNTRENLRLSTKMKWGVMPPLKRFPIMELGLTPKRMKKADWNDKMWISKLAKKKIDQFYFKVASTRAEYGMKLYKTLYQTHFGTDRFLNIFFAYMVSKFEDALLRVGCLFSGTTTFCCIHPCVSLLSLNKAERLKNQEAIQCSYRQGYPFLPGQLSAAVCQPQQGITLMLYSSISLHFL